jgi:alkylation response protein AidB-like acyl-CoA dehydrogenase
MDFDYTENQTELRDMLERYIANEYPFATRDRISKSPLGFSREIWQELGSLGVIGALFPEAVGGYGGTGFDIALVFECLGGGLALEPFTSVLLSGRVLARAGTSVHKAEIVRMIEGVSLIAFAHDESGAHYTVSHVQTGAHQQNGEWILNGTKSAVLHGQNADGFLVSARTGGTVEDSQGISLFLVPAGLPGMAVRSFSTIDGGRAADLTFDDVRLAASALVGEAGEGMASIEDAVGAGILGLCAEALGAMEKAKAVTLDYLRGRKQFGVAIGAFQAIQHRMATLFLEIEQARSAVIHAASALDSNRLNRECALSAAKYSVGRIGTLVAEECIQLHGAIGMTWELPLAHYAKRLVMIDHQLGDEDFHLERYIELERERNTG